MTHFFRYIGIDYSGAKLPTSGLPGLRVYEASPDLSSREILPPLGSSKYWSRRGIAEWLREELRDGPPTLVGIDHSFSFPLRYFELHQLPLVWDDFLSDFCHHWPTDDDDTSVQNVRDGLSGKGAERSGNARWRRITEERSRGAKSVFHFDVQGSVAKSTHSGIPWLHYLRRQLGERVHFWPFDGWSPPRDRSVIAEIYPSLWNRNFPREDRSPDQHDAYSIARWMQETDRCGSLTAYFSPDLSREMKAVADVEGWILGVFPGSAEP